MFASCAVRTFMALHLNLMAIPSRSDLVLNQIGRAALIAKQIYVKRLAIPGPSNIINVKVSVSELSMRRKVIL